MAEKQLHKCDSTGWLNAQVGQKKLLEGARDSGEIMDSIVGGIRTMSGDVRAVLDETPRGLGSLTILKKGSEERLREVLFEKTVVDWLEGTGAGGYLP